MALSFIEWSEVNMSIKMFINLIYTSCYLLTTPVPAVNRVLNDSLIMSSCGALSYHI